MKEISARALTEKIAHQESLHLVDVREAVEVAQGMIPGSKHIPLQEIPQRVNEFNKNEEYIIICRSGNRSGVAQEFLIGHGVNAVNLAGGVINWNGELE